MDPRKLVTALHIPTMLLGLWFLFIQPHVSDALPTEKAQGIGILLVLAGLAWNPSASSSTPFDPRPSLPPSVSAPTA